MSDDKEAKREAVEEAEALLRNQAAEDRDRVLADMRTQRNAKTFDNLPIQVVENLRHFELDVHDVVTEVHFEGQVGPMFAWSVVMATKRSYLIVFDTTSNYVCGHFEQDGGTLDLIALLYGIAVRKQLNDQLEKRIEGGQWPA